MGLPTFKYNFYVMFGHITKNICRQIIELNENGELNAEVENMRIIEIA
jgi:hypothetical protein